MFKNIREDWQTYERDIWRQGFWTMLVFRFGQWRYRVRPIMLRKLLSLVYKILRTACQMATGIELPCETRIGRRLRIEHFGGIIVSGDTRLGDDVILRQGVTLGLRNTNQRGAPDVGNRVDIGAGAKLLGPIKIGDDAVIGANAVVLCDVPAGALAVGIPARIIERKTSLPEKQLQRVIRPRKPSRRTFVRADAHRLNTSRGLVLRRNQLERRKAAGAAARSIRYP